MSDAEESFNKMYENNSSAHKREKVKAMLKLALLAVILAGIPAFLYFKYGAGVFSKDSVGQVLAFLRLHRSASALIVIGIQALQVIICILPGQPVQFAASYMFGVFFGFLLSIAGAVIGAAASFFIARLLGRDAIHFIFGEEKIQSYQSKLNSPRGIFLVFLIYLIPGVPKDLVSYAAGVSEMSFRPFIIASTIGRSPGMLGSLLFGHFFGRQNYRAIAILSVITLVLLIVCIAKRKQMLEFIDSIEQKKK